MKGGVLKGKLCCGWGWWSNRNPPGGVPHVRKGFRDPQDTPLGCFLGFFRGFHFFAMGLFSNPALFSQQAARGCAHSVCFFLR